MPVNIEQLGGLERRMTFGISEERIYEAVRKRIVDLSRQVKLDGFRKGRAPLSVVDQKLGPQVRQDVIGELLLTTFYEAASQERLNLASQPRIVWKQPVAALLDAAPEFEAVFEVYPEFDLAPIEAIRIERPVADISENDVDAMLAALQRLNLEWQPVDRPARLGDRVMVDMQGHMDDEPLREIRQIPFVIGRPAQTEIFGGIVQDEFARQLEGVSPGHFVDMEIGFPEEYPKQYLAGQNVRFTLRLRSVEEPRLPELDDELARKLGVAEGGLASLREQTRSMMAEELRQGQRESMKDQVLDALLCANPVPLPKARVEVESARLMEQVRARMQADGLNDNDTELAALLVEEKARRRVGLGLILARIVRENGLEIPREHLERIGEELAAATKAPSVARDKEGLPGDADLMAELESSLLEEQVVDWVLSRAQVIDKVVSFAEFMKGRLQGGLAD